MAASLLLLIAAAQAPAFPERVPGMMEDCLLAAVGAQAVTLTPEGHKYICSDQPAERLWRWLEAAKIAAEEQDTGAEGVWLSRYFPLGGCFKRLRLADGTATATGLSCSIWIPRAQEPALRATPD